MEEIKLDPVATDFYKVSDFVAGLLEKLDCPIKIRTKLDIVIDELFGNIVKYSGAKNISVRAGEESSGIFSLSFIDDGKPYNPLDAPNPCTDADIDDRPIGGLGIFIVKKTVDDVFYEYKDGHNNLTIKKKL